MSDNGKTVLATLGKAGIHDEGEWSSSKAYERLALVTSEKSLYLARTAVPAGTALGSPDHWRELVCFDGDWDALEEELRADYATAKAKWQGQVDSLVGQRLEYDEEKGCYTNLGAYWYARRDGKVYTSRIPLYSFSTSTDCVKADDNAGLVAEPSTATSAGRDDYAPLNAWQAVDCNVKMVDGELKVTAMRGDGHGFALDGSNGPVCVMKPPRFYRVTTEERYTVLSMSDTQHAGFSPWPGLERLDKTLPGYQLYAKYGGATLGGKYTSASGLPLLTRTVSHNALHGFEYDDGFTGMSYTDWFELWAMFALKYGTKSSQSVMRGCADYAYQYQTAEATDGGSCVVLTSAQAANLVAGSSVICGTSASAPDRYNANARDVFDARRITSVEQIGDGLAKVHVEGDPFTAAKGCWVSTYPWHTGACDGVLGLDGSPSSNTSGKEPFKLQGIEYMYGAYEVLSDIIMDARERGGVLEEELYACLDQSKLASSVTEDYEDTGLSLPVAGSDGWSYSADMRVSDHGVPCPDGFGATSTTGTGDGVYQDVSTSKGLREVLLFGDLWNGSLSGSSCVYGGDGLGNVWWDIASRSSPKRSAGVSA